MIMQSDVMQTPQLSAKELQDLKNKRTGLAIFQLSWIMVFVCLTLVNLSIRGSAAAWPPPGVEKLGVLVPTLMTLALFVSSLLVRRAVKAIKTDQVETFLNQWRLALGLGVLFVLVMAIEWLTVPISGQYSDLFRVLVGFHGVHALAIGVYMFKVYREGRSFNALHFWPVEAAAGLWYFVTVAWILFYTVLYII